MIIDGKRELVYIAKITNIQPLDGYDRVELVTVNDGWRVIVSKADNFQVGNFCVYFEIDSKVPVEERYAFLEKRNYKIKTQKMCKTISQGLVMPILTFPEIGDDVYLNRPLTDLLHVTYAVAEDNQRKSGKLNPELKYNSMVARHKELFKKFPFNKLLRKKWGRKLLFVFFGKKKDNPKGFPSFVSKTDEERVENCPWVLQDQNKEWIATEKLDGTSCTYALKRLGKNKFEFYVCSRNVRQKDENQSCYHDHNIYWDLAFKYNIEEHLKEYLNSDNKLEWVCIQGEGVGHVQGNPLKLKEDDLYVFNFITSNEGRFNSVKAKMLIEDWGMKFVPILDLTTTLPDNMECMKLLADGKSVINTNVMREGIVYRSLDGKDSFKNVSRKYLLKHGE